MLVFIFKHMLINSHHLIYQKADWIWGMYEEVGKGLPDVSICPLATLLTVLH